MSHPVIAERASLVERAVHDAATVSLMLCNAVMTSQVVTPEDRACALRHAAWNLTQALARRAVQVELHLHDMNAWQLAQVCEELLGARAAASPAGPQFIAA